MNLSVVLARGDDLLHTVLVVAVTCDGHNLGAHLCALLRDVVLADVLSRDESGQDSGNGELLKEHCDGFLGLVDSLEWCRSPAVGIVVKCLVVVMTLEPVDEAGLYTHLQAHDQREIPTHRQVHQNQTSLATLLRKCLDIVGQIRVCLDMKGNDGCQVTETSDI